MNQLIKLRKISQSIHKELESCKAMPSMLTYRPHKRALKKMERNDKILKSRIIEEYKY